MEMAWLEKVFVGNAFLLTKLTFSSFTSSNIITAYSAGLLTMHFSNEYNKAAMERLAIYVKCFYHRFLDLSKWYS